MNSIFVNLLYFDIFGMVFCYCSYFLFLFFFFNLSSSELEWLLAVKHIINSFKECPRLKEIDNNTKKNDEIKFQFIGE